MKNLLKFLLMNIFYQQKKYADIIIPRGGDNFVAINLLVQHINLKLQDVDMSINKKNF